MVKYNGVHWAEIELPLLDTMLGVIIIAIILHLDSPQLEIRYHALFNLEGDKQGRLLYPQITLCLMFVQVAVLLDNEESV